MSRVLPILFNSDMVRAILDGRKTVTRRVAKNAVGAYKVEFDPEEGWEAHVGDGNKNIFFDIDIPLKPPYQTDDILYVRETWFYEMHMHDRTDGEPDLPGGRYSHRYMYKADSPDYPVDAGVGGTGWKPSIFMPKEAARLWLKVTNVRVEKLHDMNGQDVLKEGINSHVHPDADYFDGNQKEMFEKVWDSTIKKSDLDRYGWNADPWVWVIEFELCEKPEEV